MNHKNKVIKLSKMTLSGFFSCLFVMGTSAVQAENLLQVYEHAKTNDAQLKISEVSFLATLEAKPQIISGLKP